MSPEHITIQALWIINIILGLVLLWVLAWVLTIPRHRWRYFKEMYDPESAYGPVRNYGLPGWKCLKCGMVYHGFDTKQPYPSIVHVKRPDSFLKPSCKEHIVCTIMKS